MGCSVMTVSGNVANIFPTYKVHIIVIALLVSSLQWFWRYLKLTQSHCRHFHSTVSCHHCDIVTITVTLTPLSISVATLLDSHCVTCHCQASLKDISGIWCYWFSRFWIGDGCTYGCWLVYWCDTRICSCRASYESSKSKHSLVLDLMNHLVSSAGLLCGSTCLMESSLLAQPSPVPSPSWLCDTLT